MTTEFYFWVNHYFNQHMNCLIVRYCISYYPCISHFTFKQNMNEWSDAVTVGALNKHLTDPLMPFAFTLLHPSSSISL